MGFESVWTCNGANVIRMSLDPLAEVSTIPAQKTATQGNLGTGFGRVWVLQGDGSALAGIDPETEAVADPFPLPIRGTDLAVSDDGIWIVSAVDDAVLLVDPADGTVRQRIDALDSPALVSIIDDAVWVADTDAVHRIDPATGAIITLNPGGPGRPGALAADAEGVWVRAAAEVRHIDGDGVTVGATFSLDFAEPNAGDMIVAFGALWATASEEAALFRIALE